MRSMHLMQRFVLIRFLIVEVENKSQKKKQLVSNIHFYWIVSMSSHKTSNIFLWPFTYELSFEGLDSFKMVIFLYMTA